MERNSNRYIDIWRKRERARERKEERARERVKIKRGAFILKDGQKNLEYIKQEVKKSDRTTKDNLQVVWQQPIDTHTYTHTNQFLKRVGLCFSCRRVALP